MVLTHGFIFPYALGCPNKPNIIYEKLIAGIIGNQYDITFLHKRFSSEKVFVFPTNYFDILTS